MLSICMQSLLFLNNKLVKNIIFHHRKHVVVKFMKKKLSFPSDIKTLVKRWHGSDTTSTWLLLHILFRLNQSHCSYIVYAILNVIVIGFSFFHHYRSCLHIHFEALCVLFLFDTSIKTWIKFMPCYVLQKAYKVWTLLQVQVCCQ